MARQIDPIKKAKYKRARKAGQAKEKALKTAGYAKTTAEHMQGKLKLVKIVEAEIQTELKAKDVTIDYVVNNAKIIMDKANNADDRTNGLRANRDIADFAGLLKHNVDTQTINVYNLAPNETDKDKLTQLIRAKND